MNRSVEFFLNQNTNGVFYAKKTNKNKTPKKQKTKQNTPQDIFLHFSNT